MHVKFEILVPVLIALLQCTLHTDAQPTLTATIVSNAQPTTEDGQNNGEVTTITESRQSNTSPQTSSLETFATFSAFDRILESIRQSEKPKEPDEQENLFKSVRKFINEISTISSEDRDMIMSTILINYQLYIQPFTMTMGLMKIDQLYKEETEALLINAENSLWRHFDQLNLVDILTKEELLLLVKHARDYYEKSIEEYEAEEGQSEGYSELEPKGKKIVSALVQGYVWFMCEVDHDMSMTNRNILSREDAEIRMQVAKAEIGSLFEKLKEENLLPEMEKNLEELTIEAYLESIEELKKPKEERIRSKGLKDRARQFMKSLCKTVMSPKSNRQQATSKEQEEDEFDNIIVSKILEKQQQLINEVNMYTERSGNHKLTDESAQNFLSIAKNSYLDKFNEFRWNGKQLSAVEEEQFMKLVMKEFQKSIEEFKKPKDQRKQVPSEAQKQFEQILKEVMNGQAYERQKKELKDKFELKKQFEAVVTSIVLQHRVAIDYIKRRMNRSPQRSISTQEAEAHIQTARKNTVELFANFKHLDILQYSQDQEQLTKLIVEYYQKSVEDLKKTNSEDQLKPDDVQDKQFEQLLSETIEEQRKLAEQKKLSYLNKMMVSNIVERRQVIIEEINRALQLSKQDRLSEKRAAEFTNKIEEAYQSLFRNFKNLGRPLSVEEKEEFMQVIMNEFQKLIDELKVSGKTRPQEQLEKEDEHFKTILNDIIQTQEVHQKQEENANKLHKMMNKTVAIMRTARTITQDLLTRLNNKQLFTPKSKSVMHMAGQSYQELIKELGKIGAILVY